jgi:hypothetical protein
MPSTIQLATPRRWRMTPTRHPAKPCVIYVTTARQGSRFGIPSQHSGNQERDRPYGPNNYLAHINLPTVQRPCDEISIKRNFFDPAWIEVRLKFSGQAQRL